MDATQSQSDHDIIIRIDERVNALHMKVDKLTDDHEDRIRSLEKEANRWLGRQSMIGGIIGIGASFLAALFNAHIL